MLAVPEGLHGAKRRSRPVQILSILAISTALSVPLYAKHKDDVVIMINGDKFTGEIKKLENGVLYFRADYMVDPVQLDWSRVVRLTSSDRFHVFFADGRNIIGTIETGPETHDGNGNFILRPVGPEIRSSAPQVVSLVPVEDKFWAQLTGSLDYGFAYTGGTNTIQSTFSGDLIYLAEKWRVQLNGGSVLNYQSGARTSGRDNLDFLYIRSVSPRWFVAGDSSLLSSDQQDLTLRATAGGGVGTDFVKSGTAGVFALAGVVFSREQYSSDIGGQPVGDQAEARFQLEASKSTFKRMQLNGRLVASPNLTTLGRVRLSLESNLKIELVRNLYWKFSLYENYDNRPPVIAPKNDFGTSTSFGWKF